VSKDNSPAYQAYTVIKREGQDDFWVSIGAAFAHKDGDGYNIVLQALPLDGKIVLRPPKDSNADENERIRQATREANDRRRRDRSLRSV
jgi:hypothetical protein